MFEFLCVGRLAQAKRKPKRPAFSLFLARENAGNGLKFSRAAKEKRPCGAQHPRPEFPSLPATQWLAQFYNRHKQATPAQQAAAEFWRARPDRPSLELWKAAVAFDGDWKERTSQLEQLPAMTDLLRVQLAVLDERAARGNARSFYRAAGSGSAPANCTNAWTPLEQGCNTSAPNAKPTNAAPPCSTNSSKRALHAIVV